MAVFILLLGMIGAEGLYWLETRTADAPESLLLGNEKGRSRQMEALYGKSNADLQEWLVELKHRPGEQAALVFGAAVLLAGGCFYAAHWFNAGGDEG